MNNSTYYCVLKNYKGLFRKKHLGNTHLFLVPIDTDNYLYLGLIGELEEEPGTYATQLIVKLPSEIIEDVITEEINYFKGRYQVIEELNSTPKKIESGHYDIKIIKPGKFIKSKNLDIEFNVDYSTNSRRIYLIKGEFEFESSDITSNSNVGMMANKQMAYMGSKTRFEQFIFGGSKY